MTAEIAVYNRSGIALAADSAVTTTNGFSEKIYNNADKLFELSKHHPVALMIYNNAGICGAPWELMIKAYRKNLGDKSFNYISEYASDFFKFVQTNQNIVPADMQGKYFFSLFSDAILPKILNDVQDEDVAGYIKANNSPPSFEEYHHFIEMRCRRRFGEVNSNLFFDGFAQADFDKAFAELSQVIDQLCALRIQPNIDSPDTPYSESLKEALTLLFSAYMCKENDLQTYSGVVFAGYGDQEFYPSIESHHIYGVYNGKVMKPSTKDKDNTGSSIGIFPFAQEDEVHTFMQGCSQGILKCVDDSVFGSMQKLKMEVTGLISAQHPSVPRSDIEAAFDATIATTEGDTREALENHMTLNHVQKVLSVLGSLAKVDLGYMAESLVNLTAFKRKVSNDSDSVGGPIDVAVLSKGDGFVWMKRKHYFDKELNYQFFKRT